jgi:CubicO group peptidase (beta-lactamase class C family)
MASEPVIHCILLAALVGTWASVTDAPVLHGQITVKREAGHWRGTIANAVASDAETDARVRLVFPSGQGEFRGDIVPNGTLDGFWLQPPTVSGEAYASPLVLRAVSSNVWRGVVQPLHDRFSLYLTISRGSDGALTGAFRNPESHGGELRFAVTQKGDALQFQRQGMQLRATLTPAGIEMLWPEMGKTVRLTRLPADAIDLYPRRADVAAYVYQQPPDTGDGWATARAAVEGLDEAMLARLVQRLGSPDSAVRQNALIHSLLIARHGKLVLDEYFFGFDRDTVHDLRSAGKTYASVMLGSAMMRRIAISPDTRIYGLLQSMGPFANPDPRKALITLANLMTHASGLACDDNDDASPGNEDRMQSQTQQPNWWKYTLDLSLLYDPGTHYAYCSAGMNLVGAALTTSTQTWLPQWFDSTVARPLQFGTYYWNLMPTGEGYMGGGAFVRPRDLLKLGQAYLDGGEWNGRRIVDASWVALSTAPHSPPTDATSGTFDGYAWHLGTLHVGDRSYREYNAGGNGGQLLIVIPDLDMTIVFTAGNYGQYGVWGKFLTQIVPQEIIPAVRN